jgi:hypothetical protein
MNTKLVLGCFAIAACWQHSTATVDPAELPSQATEVALESCNKSYQFQLPASAAPPGATAPQPQTVWYAEHAYPKRTKEDLAGRVRNWVRLADASAASQLARQYEWAPQFEIYLRDGMAAVPCGSPNQTTMFVYTK